MKKFFLLVAVAAMTVTTVCANQFTDDKDLKKELKGVKAQAKQYAKDGWKVIGADKSIEMQITEGIKKGAETVTDRNGEVSEKYAKESSTAIGRTQELALSAAREACRRHITEDLQTKVAAAIERDLGENAISGAAVDEYRAKTKQIADAAISNTKPVLTLIREKGNEYEAMVTIMYNKQEVTKRIEDKLNQELADRINKIGAKPISID